MSLMAKSIWLFYKPRLIPSAYMLSSALSLFSPIFLN